MYVQDENKLGLKQWKGTIIEAVRDGLPSVYWIRTQFVPCNRQPIDPQIVVSRDLSV